MFYKISLKSISFLILITHLLGKFIRYTKYIRYKYKYIRRSNKSNFMSDCNNLKRKSQGNEN